MDENLLGLLDQELGENLSIQASGFLAEPEPAIQKSLQALLPVILSRIAQKGSTPNGAVTLLNLLQGDTGLIDHVDQLFTGNEISADWLANAGTGMAYWLFGETSVPLAEAAASVGGLNAAAGEKLLSLAVPLVLSFLKKYSFGKGLDPGSLATLLSNQEKYLQDNLDRGLLQVLQPNATAVDTRLPPIHFDPDKASPGRWLTWLPLIFGLLVLVYFWQVFRQPKHEIQAPSPVATTRPARILPAEIYFKANDDGITDEGNQVIHKVAELAKEAGILRLEVIGFSNQTDDVERRQDLAEKRASSVRDGLILAGIPKDRIVTKFFVLYSGHSDKGRRVEIDQSP